MEFVKVNSQDLQIVFSAVVELITAMDVAFDVVKQDYKVASLQSEPIKNYFEAIASISSASKLSAEQTADTIMRIKDAQIKKITSEGVYYPLLHREIKAWLAKRS